MKKSALSLAALVLISASSIPASAQSPSVGSNAVSGSNAGHQWVGGCNPRPQGVFGNIYAAVVSLFGF